MKLLFRVLTAILFVLFFGFALENTQEVALHFFLGYEIRGPLVLLLLAFLILGAVLGVLAMTPTVFRHKRDLSKHRQMVSNMEKRAEEQQVARSQPPLPDSVVSR